MANTFFNAGLNPENITAQVPYVSSSKLQEIIDIWLPLFNSNAIDLDTLLAKIPEIDAETVKDNLEKKLQDTLDQFHAQETAHQAEMIANNGSTQRGAQNGGQQ